MRKIGIIGLGHVGEMLANQLVMNGKVDELVLIDEKDGMKEMQISQPLS